MRPTGQLLIDLLLDDLDAEQINRLGDPGVDQAHARVLRLKGEIVPMLIGLCGADREPMRLESTVRAWMAAMLVRNNLILRAMSYPEARGPKEQMLRRLRRWLSRMVSGTQG